jgi:FKBP-type peptidyl-prolyl cis-trans isomerase FklB
MKKILFVALALLASASFSTIDAKKKKENKKAEAVTPVQLKNGSDSLSYTAGMVVTDGLIPYLLQQGVDTAFMADFVAGFKEAIAADSDPHQKARIVGMDIANQVMQRMIPSMAKEFTGTPDSVVKEMYYRGFTDAILNDTTVMNMTAAKDLFKKKQTFNKEAKNAPNREAGRKFLAENKLKDSVITTPSGLQYKILKQGDGVVPQKTDKVKVHYEGRLIDGTVFDASTKHGSEPATFRADQVIKGWTEALTMMPVGSKWQLFIPYELAYGERNAGQLIKPYSALIFDVELVGIEK